MNRRFAFTLVAPLLALGGCNVTDNNNGSATISLDENRIEAGTDLLANEAAKAGDQAANAIQNAGPEIRESANDIQQRAGRVADRVDNIDVDVDVDTSNGNATANAQ